MARQLDWSDPKLAGWLEAQLAAAPPALSRERRERLAGLYGVQLAQDEDE